VIVLLRRLGAGLSSVLALGLIALLCAPGASAHVTASSPNAVQGKSGQITFTVPSESATARTTQIVATFPTDTPIASVRTLPTPGWTAAIVTQTLPAPVTIAGREITTAVDTITWTADADGIGPTEYQTFTVSGGPLPTTDTITFRVLQRYSDGTEANWADVAAAGSADEPEHPAPVLALAPATESSGSTGGETPGAAGAGDDGASGVAIAALIVGIVAAVLAAGSLLLARRPRR